MIRMISKNVENTRIKKNNPSRPICVVQTLFICDYVSFIAGFNLKKPQ